MNTKHNTLISRLIHANIVTSPLHLHCCIGFMLLENIVKALYACGVNNALIQPFSWLSTKDSMEKEQVNLPSTPKTFARYWWNTSGHYVSFRLLCFILCMCLLSSLEMHTFHWATIILHVLVDFLSLIFNISVIL